MRRLGPCAWVAVLVPLLASAAQLARAQAVVPPADAPKATAPVVEMVVVGGGHEAFALLDTVRDLLGRVGLVLEAHAVATPVEGAAVPRGSGVARVEVDLRSPGEALIVTEGRRQGPKERRVRRDPSASIAREELAQAIQSGVEAQLFRDPEGRVSAEPPGDGGVPSASAPAPAPAPASAPAPAPASAPSAPPAPAPSAPPGLQPDAPPQVVPFAVPTARDSASAARPPGPVALDISTLAGGGFYATGTGPVAELGGDVTLAGRRGWRPSLALSARAVLPFAGSVDEVTGHVSAFALRALGGVDVARTSWLELAGGGGGGVDVLWASSTSAVLPQGVLMGDATRADPVVTAFVAAHVRLVPSVVLTVMALGDVDLEPSRFVVQNGPTPDPLVAPWRVRPTLLAGFTFTALGQPAFARVPGP